MKILPLFLRLTGVLLGVALATAGLALPAEATTPVHLSGTVTSADGTPQNGLVYLERLATGSASGHGLSNGTFAIDWNSDTNMEGDYLIRVQSFTMDRTERYYVAGNSAGTTQRALATPVHLGAGAPDVSVTMVMPVIAKVSGQVVGSDGAGLSGVTVSVNIESSVRDVTSGPDGSFDFGYTRAGTWHVIAGGGRTGYLRADADVVVPASGSVVMPDIVLKKAAGISGQVTDSVTGDPVPFVQVVAYNATTHAQMGWPADTDATGHYSFAGLTSTPFVLRFNDVADNDHGYTWTLNDGGDPNDFSPQTPITLAEGEQRTYDQQLVLKAAPTPPAHTISGTVTDIEGSPLVGIDVATGDLEATTDRRGHWYLDAPVGPHGLTFAASDRWLQVFGSGPGWFPITATASTGTVDVSLRRAGRINGTLLAADDAEVGERELWLYDAAGNVIGHESGNDGDRFQLDAPAGVPVYLLARAWTADEPITALMPRWYGDVDSRAAATSILVGAGQTVTGKDVTLPTGLTNTTVPVVSGTRAVGRTLTASTGTWSTMTQTGFATTWWRGSLLVGMGPSYVVKPADAGSALRARVVAVNGGVSTIAYSASATVAKLVPSVSVRGTSPRAGVARLAVTVRTTGLNPNGTLVVKRGARIVKRVRLVNGAAVVTLIRQPRGVQRYVVSYSGSPQVAARTSPVVRIRVR